MSESSGEKSPQEQADYEQAIRFIDPGGHTVPQLNYFVRRLAEVRKLDDEAVPPDTSDAWVFRDQRFIDASRRHHERFDEAADAVARLLAAEREVYETRETIEHEVSSMLIPRNQLARKDTLTTADFLLDGDNPPIIE